MYEGTCITTAYLTPAWLCPCRGYVHSVFHRVANVMLQNGEAQRMLALTMPGLPRLPDSVCLPGPVLEALEPGMPAWLDKDKFQLNGRSFSLRTDNGWSGRIEPMNGQPDVRTFLQATENLTSGLDSLPSGIRRRAEGALLSPEAGRFLGLGRGLTPSFDDACVGVMAVCRAFGQAAPFALTCLEDTTDVSARYLRLAQEGYFGQPVADVVDAVYGCGSLARAIPDLLAVGATSGSDMLWGMRMYFLKMINI